MKPIPLLAVVGFVVFVVAAVWSMLVVIEDNMGCRDVYDVTGKLIGFSCPASTPTTPCRARALH